MRKHLSQTKGGQLAAAAKCPVVTLVLSDVIGDHLEIIASGPTVPDPSTFVDALEIVRRAAEGEVPDSVLTRVEMGVSGDIQETPKALTSSGCVHVVGSNGIACEAAVQTAAGFGYDVRVHTLGLSGDVGDAVEEVCRMIGEGDAKKPSCVILAGETTVRMLGGPPETHAGKTSCP